MGTRSELRVTPRSEIRASGPGTDLPDDCSPIGSTPLALPASRAPKSRDALRTAVLITPETRWSRTFAAYLLSIFKDVYPVGRHVRDPILVEVG
jgi:hypothetical protein